MNLECELGVWLLPLNATCDAKLASAQLTDDERARLERYTSAARRQEFALCRALLRGVLSRFGYTASARAQLVEGPHGKPAFATAHAPQFNLSHAQGMAVLVVGGQAPLGADIEPAERHLQSKLLAPRYCHARELEWLAEPGLDAAEHRRRFLRLWVRKEAVLKARGDGVHGGPRRVDSVSTPGYADYHTPNGDTVERWKVLDIDARDDYFVAVACTVNTPPPSVTVLERLEALI